MFSLLMCNAGVHFTLCGGTICKLGTGKHHEAYLPRMNTLDLPGCFGMTELGHGSNVMGIETTVRVAELLDIFKSLSKRLLWTICLSRLG